MNRKRVILYTVIIAANSSLYSQHISEFVSLTPSTQNSEFHLPASHAMQYIIKFRDTLTQGGTLPENNDFTGYVPINERSDSAYLFINSERIPGGATVLDIGLNHSLRKWEVFHSEKVNFSGVGGTARNCSGGITPWNTVITCEEQVSGDGNADGYNDFGWAIEVNPATKLVVDHPGGLVGADKLWALGNFRHENAVIHTNSRTVYEGVDDATGYLYKFVADSSEKLYQGSLFVYKGSKSGNGRWIAVANDTPVEQNTTLTQSAALGATVFSGIEDVEISPIDGKVYVAVKSENRVYRFTDGDPLLGDTVLDFETYVGGMSYDIMDGQDTITEPWGTGNDNLAFDDHGNLWVCQDGGRNYVWVVDSGHTQANPKVRIFAKSPTGSEPTGMTFSPDFRYIFMSIQHPNAANGVTMQPDAFGKLMAFDTSVTVVISLNQYLNNPTITIADTVYVCDGDSIFIAGQYETSAGTYHNSLQSVTLADSVLITTIVVDDTYELPVETAICDGDSIYLGARYRSTSGIYRDTLATIAGCDSVLVVTLSVHSTSLVPYATSMCAGDSLLVGGAYQFVAGTYHDSLISGHGCDSVLATTITIYPSYNILLNESICTGDSLFLQGSYQIAAGNYRDSLLTGYGCDSVLETTLGLYGLPTVELATFNSDTVCLKEGPVTLPVGTPGGGLYSGPGVVGSDFNPGIAGIGKHIIIYRYADGNGCSNADSTFITVKECMWMAENSASSVSMHPNPTTGSFNIDLGKICANISLLITDTRGKVLHQATYSNEQRFSVVEVLPAGIYFVHLRMESDRIVKRLVVE